MPSSSVYVEVYVETTPAIPTTVTLSADPPDTDVTLTPDPTN